MTYVDPYTGEVLQCPADEVPDAAEILDDFDEDDEFEGIDDYVAAPAEMDLASSFRSRRSEGGQKIVRFTPPGTNGLRPARNPRQTPSFYASGRDSPSLRSQNAGMVFKETIVPVYDSNRPGDLFNKMSKSSVGVSPLTIFALARSRREKEAKAARRHGRLRQKQGITGISGLGTEEQSMDDFELNDDDFARLMDNMDLNYPADGRESVGSSRPPSVRKSESSLMRWCIGALKKADREVLFPPKPTRPNSSPSAVKSKALRKEAGGYRVDSEVTQQDG